MWCSGIVSTLGADSINQLGRTKDFIKMVVMAALLGAQGCGVSITIDWLVSGNNGPVVLVTYPGEP